MTEPANRLEEAFGAFNRLSEELAGAYRDLEQRAAGLADELALSRREKERQRAEKERLADRLSALIDSLPGGVVVLDQDDRIRESNAPARQWLGGDIEGERLSAVLARARSGAAANDELLLADGRRLTLSERAVEGGGETIVLLTDVTEQRRLQVRLDRNRRLAAMGEMAARLAHQVRTPLSSALLYASHLTDRRLTDGRRVRFGRRLIERLRDLEHMTRDMLGFVRGGCGPTENLDLGELIEDVRRSLSASVEDGARLEIHHRTGPAHVQGDRQALVGALCNLVENAWQAGGDGVRVSLCTRCNEAGTVAVEVLDDGPGVEASDRARIFEPFFTRRAGGTGLGLAVARSVAEAHHGELSYEPRTGGGSRFVLVLPRVGAERLLPEPAVLAGGAG